MRIKSYKINNNYPNQKKIEIKDLILADDRGARYQCENIATEYKYIYWDKSGIGFTNSIPSLEQQILFINNNGSGFVVHDNKICEKSIHEIITDEEKEKLPEIRIKSGHEVKI